MAKDITRSRVPEPRVVQVPKDRADEPGDSILATVRGEDLSTPQKFTPDEFLSFEQTIGPNSPQDREDRTPYVLETPDTTRWLTLFWNTQPASPNLDSMFIQASYTGDTSLPLSIGPPVPIGGFGGFADLAETIAEPDTTPSELPYRVASYVSGVFAFGPVFRGRIQVKLHATLAVDVGADVTVTWTLQSRVGPLGAWNDLALLGKESYRANETPVVVNYASRWLTHFKETHYRITVGRTAGPAGVMNITLTDPWITANMKILQA